MDRCATRGLGECIASEEEEELFCWKAASAARKLMGLEPSSGLSGVAIARSVGPGVGVAMFGVHNGLWLECPSEEAASFRRRRNQRGCGSIVTEPNIGVQAERECVCAMAEDG